MIKFNKLVEWWRSSSEWGISRKKAMKEQVRSGRKKESKNKFGFGWDVFKIIVALCRFIKKRATLNS